MHNVLALFLSVVIDNPCAELHVYFVILKLNVNDIQYVDIMCKSQFYDLHDLTVNVDV